MPRLGTIGNRIVDAGVDIASVGLASLVFLLIFGRAINSPTAFKLQTMPGLDKLIPPLRAATNQGYDVRGED